MAKKRKKLLEDAHEAPVVSPKKKKKGSRPDVSRRRANKKFFSNVTVKTCLNGFVKHHVLADRIENCVQWLSHLTVEANQLASFHIHRLLEDGIMPDNFTLKSNEFYNKVFRLCKNIMVGELPDENTPLDVSAKAYAAIRPIVAAPSYETWFSRPLEEAAKSASTNAITHITTNFDIYTRRYFKLLCTPENGPLSEMPTEKFNSLMSVGWKALEEGGDVMQLAQERKTLKGLLSNEHAAFVQRIVDIIRQSLPKSKSHGAILKFLYQILQPLHSRGEELRVEAEIQSRQDSIFNSSTQNGEPSKSKKEKKKEKNGKRRLKGKYAFSLLPQASVRAKYIRLSTTGLKALVKDLAAVKKNKDGDHVVFMKIQKSEAGNSFRNDGIAKPLLEEKARLLQPCETARMVAEELFDTSASGSNSEEVEKKKKKAGQEAFDDVKSQLPDDVLDRLADIDTSVNQLEYEKNLYLWKKCFDLKKILNSHSDGKKKFANSIMTDGIGVSALTEVAKSEEQIESQKVASSVTESKKAHKIKVREALEAGKKPPKRTKTELEKKQEVSLEEQRKAASQKALDLTGLKVLDNGLHTVNPGARIVGVDPGKKKPATWAVYTPEAEAHLHGSECSCSSCHDPSHVLFETGTVKKNEWYRMCGFTRRTKQMNHWLERDTTGVKDFQKAPTAAAPSLQGYKERCKAVLEKLDCLKKFYVSSRRVRRLKFNTYMRTQSSTEWLVSQICGNNDHIEQEKVVVGYGDASLNHNMKGTSPMTSSRFLKALKGRAVVIMTSEFRTSKLCCSCFQEMKGELMTDEEGNRSRSFGLRRCDNSDCICSLWDRDDNASINMIFKLIWSLCGEELPVEFRRKKTGEPVLEMPHEEEDVTEDDEEIDNENVANALLSI
jgi:hypothetical protein